MSDTKKKSTVFSNRRRFSRTMAIQFLYQLETQNQWEPDWDHLGDFQTIVAEAMREHLQETTEAPAEDLADEITAAWDYTEKLIRGITQCREELDAQITAAAANWSLARMGSLDRAILRLGTYEITRIEKVTAATAINEAIELAKSFGQAESARFINGVLDRIRKNWDAAKKETATPNEPQEPPASPEP